MLPSDNFGSYLASLLPLGDEVRIYHVSTPPSSAPALYAAPPDQDDDTAATTTTTTCESHFLGVTQASPDSHHASCKPDELFVLGIEVLVITTSTLTTVFVSKADSTGLLTRPSPNPGGPSVAQVVVTAFLEHLVSPCVSRRGRTVLSLFARSQNQYLFPGSVDNPTKHVLDDRQLIKWWCRVLDPVARHSRVVVRHIRGRGDEPGPQGRRDQPGRHGQSHDDPPSPEHAKAFVIVPGCDRGETQLFFPPSAKTASPSSPIWLNRYPVEHLHEDTSRPPRCLIPRLPDDPKARFCDDLDGEHVDGQGAWRSVKSLDQFWEMMSYRQECSAGRLVGFVWVVFPPGTTGASAGHEEVGRSVARPSDKAPVSEPVSVASHRTTVRGRRTSEPGSDVANHDPVPDPASHPISLRGGDQDDAVSPAPDRIMLSSEQYEELATCLLEECDFAGHDGARKSTTDWIAKLQALSGRPAIGVTVRGRHVPAAAAPAVARPERAITVLTGIRKKRKVDTLSVPETRDSIKRATGSSGLTADVPTTPAATAAEALRPADGAQTT